MEFLPINSLLESSPVPFSLKMRQIWFNFVEFVLIKHTD